ncbi:V-type ATP synthase subunit E [Candidatus Protochlamydia phocaeensis]|uniref:V-type ATP synthase subunit E n=1 Tax=Candidatus Protochlamydia phocaeensis TaxID=1414722 RepID=UPI000837CF2D|nr:V-type ATP synthase subunit E [Candidatus Protochlamydia phocaeensis]
MKSLEKGQDKIQKICDKIRHETIEPAKQEAEEILVAARKKADEITAEAERHAEQLIKQARGQIEQERNVFHSSLQQASKQTVEALRQEIEQRLFNEELQSLLEKQMSDPKLIADIITGIVKAIEKEGLNTDLSAVIPRTVSVDDINALLLENIRKRLMAKPLEIGQFAGGAQVKLHGKRMTIDLSDQAVKELLASYVRKDFRQMIFSH